MTNIELLNKIKKFVDEISDNYYEDEAHQVSRDILEYIEELEEEIKSSSNKREDD